MFCRSPKNTFYVVVTFKQFTSQTASTDVPMTDDTCGEGGVNISEWNLGRNCNYLKHVNHV